MTGKFAYPYFLPNRKKKILSFLLKFTPFAIIGLIILILKYLVNVEIILFDPFPPAIYSVGVLLLMIILLIAPLFTYDILTGEFQGKIVFEKDGITIDDEFYDINLIDNIEFSCSDFYGKLKWDTTEIVFNRRSRGTSNFVEIRTKGILPKRYYFKISYEGEIRLIKPVINGYLEKGKISLKNVDEVMRL